MWLVVRFARQCVHLGGSFAEFGTYRGGNAFMILALTDVRRLHLFDTFKGIPQERLTPYEVERGMAGHLSDTSAEYVEKRLERWGRAVRALRRRRVRDPARDGDRVARLRPHGPPARRRTGRWSTPTPGSPRAG